MKIVGRRLCDYCYGSAYGLTGDAFSKFSFDDSVSAVHPDNSACVRVFAVYPDYFFADEFASFRDVCHSANLD